MSNANFPSADLQIRPASFNDISVIRNIAYQTWPVAYGHILGEMQLKYMLERFYSTESLQKQMADKHHFLLAMLNYAPVAFASFSHEQGVTYKLQKLYVLPQVQKSGTGKQLLAHVKTIVKSMGGEILLLNVNRGNKAKLFYEQHGFTVIREEDIDIGSGYFMNDFIMSAFLGPSSGDNAGETS